MSINATKSQMELHPFRYVNSQLLLGFSFPAIAPNKADGGHGEFPISVGNPYGQDSGAMG